jgi:AsmA-like protein
MPFRARRGVIDIENGRAYGSALGITASGSLDARADAIDLRGELVPFYAVNSALGRLPLLGDIMIGGEDGGGVFSASYHVSGPLADPQISVNPVTVLFPGFLRWILEVFQGWVGGGISVDQGVTDGPDGG